MNDFLDLIAPIALAAVIYYFYNKNKKVYSELIVESDDFEETMDLRRQFRKKIQDIILIVNIVYFVLYVIISSLDAGPINFVPLIIIFVLELVLMLLLLPRTIEKSELLNLVSTKTTQEFLQEHKEYVLYLRSFDTDIYDGAVQKILPKKIDDSIVSESFSECELIEPIKTILNLSVCAVGMSKELQQPKDSADRVYTSDENWQEDVLNLIKEAKIVYVTVSSRESCLWEIRQLGEYVDKTVFIIDDTEEYQKARALVGNDEILPDISNELSLYPHAFLYWHDGKYTVRGIDYSVKGYRKLVDPAIEKLALKQLDLSGLFKTLNDAIDVSWLDDIDSSLQKVCDTVAEKCPISVNRQFMLIGCELNKSRLSVDYTVDNEVLKSINGDCSAFQWLFVNRMSDEASDDLKSVISMCANEMVFNIYNNDNNGVHRFVVEPDEL